MQVVHSATRDTIAKGCPDTSDNDCRSTSLTTLRTPPGRPRSLNPGLPGRHQSLQVERGFRPDMTIHQLKNSSLYRRAAAKTWTVALPTPNSSRSWGERIWFNFVFNLLLCYFWLASVHTDLWHIQINFERRCFISQLSWPSRLKVRFFKYYVLSGY